MMRIAMPCVWACLALAVTGCAGSIITLRHPQTGKIVTCESSSWKPVAGPFRELLETREECALRYVNAGYIIVK